MLKVELSQSLSVETQLFPPLQFLDLGLILVRLEEGSIRLELS